MTARRAERGMSSATNGWQPGGRLRRLLPVVAVVGPTATGKSDLGVALAQAIGGEVVNADAMQLYRGMDIGTAKLSLAERHGVPHHEIDVLDPAQEASVARYQEAARADLAGLVVRGARAVLVGGSGLYVRAALDPLEFPGTDPAVRAELEARVQREGSRALHGELSAVDPVAAARIHPHNARRVVRALEVIAVTGRPYSAALPGPAGAVQAVRIGLDEDRSTLDARIAARVDRMWRAGLVEEVRGLGPLGRTAARAVGYAQVLALLRGELTDDEARSATVVGTRRLARRQMGWFGRDRRVQWLRVGDPDLLERALDVVAAADAGRLPEPGAAAVRRSLGS